MVLKPESEACIAWFLDETPILHNPRVFIVTYPTKFHEPSEKEATLVLWLFGFKWCEFRSPFFRCPFGSHDSR